MSSTMTNLRAEMERALVYCTFSDCKRPEAHHNTRDHPCGKCRQPGHSRALCNDTDRELEVSRAYERDGRGSTSCRICSSDNHLTAHHPCEKCGVNNLPVGCGDDEHKLRFVESLGDYIPEASWCSEAECRNRVLHTSTGHACHICNFIHAADVKHHGIACPVCDVYTFFTHKHKFPVLGEKNKDRGCDCCVVPGLHPGVEGWPGLVLLLKCNHVVCADCTDDGCSSSELQKERQLMYGVVNDKSAAAESIRKSGFLGASGDRLFRIQDDYIMLRATIGSRTVLRNIGHLDRDAVSDIEQRLKGMGYREAGREFKMKMVSTENVLKRLDAASSNYIETLERFSELIEIAKNAAPPTDTEINPRAPEPLRAAAQRCRDAIPELYCISVDKYSRVDTSQLHTGRLQVQLRVMRGSRLTYTGILTMNDHESPLCHPSIALEHDPRYSMLLDDKYRGVRIEDVENWQGLLADAAIRMNRLIRERIDHFEGRIRAAKRADAAATAVTAASLVKSS